MTRTFSSKNTLVTLGAALLLSVLLAPVVQAMPASEPVNTAPRDYTTSTQAREQQRATTSINWIHDHHPGAGAAELGLCLRYQKPRARADPSRLKQHG
jgi:hypothetical protein